MPECTRRAQQAPTRQEGGCFSGNPHLVRDTTKDENPLSRRPVAFRPYILHGAYWYESDCFPGNEGNSVPYGPLLPPEPHRRHTVVPLIRIRGTTVCLRGGPRDGLVRVGAIGGQSRGTAWRVILQASPVITRNSEEPPRTLESSEASVLADVGGPEDGRTPAKGTSGIPLAAPLPQV